MKLLIFFVIALVVLFVLFKIFKAFLKWSIIILIIILVIAFFTNPDHTVHHESLKDYTSEKNLKKVREKLVNIDDYKIFSLTKVKVEGKERIVGIGAFGKIWYFSDIEEKFKKKKRKENS
jgi:energy-coupling factor transporter transmembrane protein EcfT